MDGQALKEKFSRLYSISQSKDSLVGDLVDREENRSIRCQTWNLSWRREMFEWEKHLEDQMSIGMGKDKIGWYGLVRITKNIQLSLVIVF